MIDGANRQDYRLLQPVLDQITAQPATARIGTLHLDRGFGYKSLPDKLDGYPISDVNVIPRNRPGQGRIQIVGFGRRWVAERTHSWFTNYGQLTTTPTAEPNTDTPPSASQPCSSSQPDSSTTAKPTTALSADAPDTRWRSAGEGPDKQRERDQQRRGDERVVGSATPGASGAG